MRNLSAYLHDETSSIIAFVKAGHRRFDNYEVFLPQTYMCYLVCCWACSCQAKVLALRLESLHIFCWLCKFLAVLIEYCIQVFFGQVYKTGDALISPRPSSRYNQSCYRISG